jgi:predicted porin
MASLLTGHSLVSALEIEPGVGAGLLYTDNAALAPDNEEDDLVVVGYAGVNINEDGGPLRMNAAAEVIHLNYTNNTFGNKTYPSLRATAGWEQIRGRLDWKVQNYFTQRRTDAVSGVTPSNIQNTNVFTFGPDITLPITGRQSVLVRPEFRDFTYEDVGTDNRQYSLSTSWDYRMYRTMGVSLNGSVVKVDYDGDGEVPDYTSTEAYVGISGTGARSVYSANFGRTNVDRDNSRNEEGFTGDLTMQYELTGLSLVRMHVASRITDTGNILLRSQTDPDDGGFSNVQTSDDVVRDSIVRLTYRRDGYTFKTSVWGELRDLDYKTDQTDQTDQSDREVKEVGAQLDYRVTPLLTTSLSGEYTRIKQTDIGTRDDRYSVIGTIGYNLSRKLSAYFDLRYQEQDSDDGFFDEYKEFSSFARLVYGFGTITRPDSGGQSGGRNRL